MTLPIEEAARLLDGVATTTPLLSSEALSRRVGRSVWLKFEHLQRTGSFKVRGAYCKIASLSPDERSHGVITASAGNHAQGVAFAASRMGVSATVVMPVYASLPKVEATRAYGAEIVLHGESFDDALSHAEHIQGDRTFVHAYNDEWVIAGQATIGRELLNQWPDGASRLVVPVGGGGLAAGIASAMDGAHEIIGVHPAQIAGTIADGAAVSHIGEACAPRLQGMDIIEVDEERVSEAMVLLLERTKQVVEGAGALPLAAVLAGEVPGDDGVVLLLSGGNIDPGLLMRVIGHGLQNAGRYLFLRLLLRDRPGELQRVLALLAAIRVNVVEVDHRRAGLNLPVDAVEIELTLETRDRTHAAEVVQMLRDNGFPPVSGTPTPPTSGR